MIENINEHKYVGLGFDHLESVQIEEIAEETLEKLLSKQSYVKRDFFRSIVRKNLPEEISSKIKIEEMLNLIISNLHIAEVGTYNKSSFITHRTILHAERETLSLAGYETNIHVLDKGLVEDAVNNKKGISQEQIDAVNECCLSKKRVSVVEGTAGAGKSFTMQAVKDAFERAGYLVTGAALSWTAAKVLESSANLSNCKAIEGLIREIKECRKQGVDFFRQPTVLIVDEAGLVGTSHMHQLLKFTHESKQPVKVILTGDSTQLSPVERGNALEAIVNYLGSVRIDTIRRQKQDSHRRAVKLFAKGAAGQGLYPYFVQEALIWNDNKGDVLNKVVQDYLSYKLANPNKKSLILALSNKDVATLNDMIRAAYKKLGKVSDDEYKIKVTDLRHVWESNFSVGDMVVFRKNDKNKPIYDMPGEAEQKKEKTKGLFNRMSGVISSIKKNPSKGYDIEVKLDGDGGFVSINTFEYEDFNNGAVPITHNFATTIYASQGQTVERVFLIDSPLMQRRLAYVGMSRHTEECTIYLNKEELGERLDKLTNSNSKGGYTKEEMLQCMAFVWGKEAKNQTALMLQMERETNKKHEVVRDFKDCLIAPGDDGCQIDYIYDYNIEHPIIDYSALMTDKDGSDDVSSNKQRGLMGIIGAMLHGEQKNTRSGAVKFIPKKETKYSVVGSGWVDVSKTTHKKIPDGGFWLKTKGVYWDIGRGGKPTILAKRKGRIVSKYDFEGNDLIGDGFPFLVPSRNKGSAIFITASAIETFLLLERFEGMADADEPHIIWGADSVDWERISKWLKGKELYIVHNKDIIGQHVWAETLHKKLEMLGISSEIRPKIRANKGLKLSPGASC